MIEQDEPFALLFIDIDGFKRVNDTMGHTVGDKVLLEASKRLQPYSNDESFISRIGGDEFIVLSKGLKNTQSLANQIIMELAKPYIVSLDEEVVLSASVGVSYYPKDAKDAVHLVKYADMAMYDVKLHGKNSYKEYTHIES